MTSRFRPDTFLNGFLFYLLVIVASVPLISSGYYALKIIQTSFVPVVTDFRVTKKIDLPAGDISISGRFHKQFPDYICKFERLRWHVLFSESIERIDYVFGDVADRIEDNNRVKGDQSFYNWELETGRYPRALRAQATVYHTCLGFWPAVTIMDEIEVRKDWQVRQYMDNTVFDIEE